MVRARLCLAVGFLVLCWRLPAAGDDRWWAHIQYLASDTLQGRLTGSEGHRLAAEYVAQQFEAAGLRPAGTAGFLQPIRLRSRRILEEQCSLELLRGAKVEKLILGEDATISVRGNPAESVEAEIVFVGHGLVVREQKYDDLAGLDLRGKIALYVTGGPPHIPGPLLAHFSSNAERTRALRRAGAVGAISIGNPKITDVPWARSSLARFQPAMSFAEPALDEDPPLAFSAAANPERADKFFAGTGHSIAAILALANEGKPLPRFAIPAKIRARVKFETAGLESQNVAGLLRGTDSRLRDEYVVLTAHLDHLGVGRPINGDSIYNGAMDNASGVATLIETARLLQAPGRRPLSRSVLFVAVTGEEKGMLGSRYFALRPTVEGRDIVANLNVDMFMPFYALKLLTVMGVDESTLGDEARAVAARLGLEVEADPEPQRNRFIRSDQYSFIRRGVPALAFKVGYAKDSPEAAIARKWLAERYHAPSDDLEQPVDRQAATDFNRFYAALVEAVANRPSRPKWREASFFRRFAKR